MKLKEGEKTQYQIEIGNYGLKDSVDINSDGVI